MGVMGLQAIYTGPNTSKKHPQHPIYPYLLRKLPITRPNHVWCSDITYIPVRRGFLYMVAILRPVGDRLQSPKGMDWATRKVLAWRISNTLDASFCVEALNAAIAKCGKPEIMNTDQGSQLTGSAWISTLTDAKIKISMPLGVCLQTPAGNRWSGPLPRQHLYRKALAITEAGGSLFARIAGRVPRQTRHRRVARILQHRATAHRA